MVKMISAEEFEINQCKQSEEFGNSLSGIYLIQKQFDLVNLSNVYHYTDINGFISIMQKHELWASHIAFMNDKMEYLHGKELFKKQMFKKISEVSSEEVVFLKQIIELLDKNQSEGVFSRSGKDIFSLSFSYNGDSLEMWRGYGKIVE